MSPVAKKMLAMLVIGSVSKAIKTSVYQIGTLVKDSAREEDNFARGNADLKGSAH